MTFHVCVLGIDGSGKSTVTASLPRVLAAEMNVLVGCAGESFWMIGPAEDHLGPRFHPDGLPLAGRLSKWLKHLAKGVANGRRLYPFLKVAQLTFQDIAAHKLGRKYRADAIVSDGNAILSSAGRAANYLRPASDHTQVKTPAPAVEDFKAALAYVLDGQPLPKGNTDKKPSPAEVRLLCRCCRLPWIKAGRLPDVVVLLDSSPKTALARIVSRGASIDRHENEEDLAQAREMYSKVLEALKWCRPTIVVERIAVDELTPGDTLRAVVDLLRPHILFRRADTARPKTPLGMSTVKLTGSVWCKLFSYQYLVHCLLGKWFRGAWREPTFALSRLGRLLIREGYSAGVMRAIYDQDERQHQLLDRIFLGYPLHQAVYDRLHILARRIERELENRLKTGSKVSIFTAPSGFAYDVFRALESIAKRTPGAMRRVRLVAADLDPHAVLANELMNRAERLGIEFEFLRSDITDHAVRARFRETAPFDVVLFVGLSSWLPKPELVRHLRWIREKTREDGLFVTDSFTPEAYALTGRYAGYKGNYYPPDVYRVVLDYCGFDGPNTVVESARNRINHVMLISPRECGTRAETVRVSDVSKTRPPSGQASLPSQDRTQLRDPRGEPCLSS